MQYDRLDRFVICNNKDLENAGKEMIELLSVGLKYLDVNNNILL